MNVVDSGDLGGLADGEGLINLVGKPKYFQSLRLDEITLTIVDLLPSASSDTTPVPEPPTMPPPDEMPPTTVDPPIQVNAWHQHLSRTRHHAPSGFWVDWACRYGRKKFFKK